MDSDKGDNQEDVPYESIRVIDDIRANKIAQGKSLAHDRGLGAACKTCGDKCSGFELHFWRQLCKNCKCPPENHDIKSELEIVQKINTLFGDKHSNNYDHFYQFSLDTCKPPSPGADSNSPKKSFKQQYETVATENQVTFEWLPQVSHTSIALKYMSSLPLELQPILGTTGASQRSKYLLRQLPNHDSNASACKTLVDEDDKRKFEKFVTNFKETAIGIGTVKEQPLGCAWTCYKCKGPMNTGDVAVFAERAGDDVCWHPACFKCKECDEMLVDLIYFWHEGNVFCGRHYASLLYPRCAACDELIFTRRFTKAEDLLWHLPHFCCWNCDEQLAGKSYVNKKNHPYCMNCYCELFAKICRKCNEKIGPDAERLEHKGVFWHADNDCFSCVNCKKLLHSSGFIFRKQTESIYCSKECKVQHLNSTKPSN